MFERYTEKARRAIFFARFEATQFGSNAIEAEHLLLGVLREDSELAARFFDQSRASLELVRKKIEASVGQFRHTSTSVDIPLSNLSKRVLAYTAEEAERLGHQHIGTEHLLLGLLREERSETAQLLNELGLQLSNIREVLASEPMAYQARTQDLAANKVPNSGSDERWPRELAAACTSLGLFTEDELMAETTRVAGLRKLLPEAEALLRLLVEKGGAEQQQLPTLSIELRDDKFLAEYLERLRMGSH